MRIGGGIAMILAGLVLMGMPHGPEYPLAPMLALLGLGAMVGGWLVATSGAKWLPSATSRQNERDLRDLEARLKEFENPALLTKAAETYLAKNKPKKAVPLLERVLTLDPTDIFAHYRLGQIAFETRRHTDAWRHFDAVFRSNPNYDYGTIKLWAARTYLELNEPELALELVRQFLATERVHIPALFVQAEALRTLNRTDEAKTAYRELLSTIETSPEFQRQRHRDIWAAARRHA